MNRHLPTRMTSSSAPTAARPTTGPAGRRSGPVCTSRSTPPGLNGSPSSVLRPKKPRTRPPARTAAPTTSRARRSAATAAVPCRRTTAPDPTRRTRTRRCRSTPATRPPCISPTTAARPPAPASTPTPTTTTAASAAARSAPRIPSTASRPRTGPPTWAAARCIT